MRRRTQVAGLAVCLAIGTTSVAAQATTQIWGNYTTDWLKSERLTWSLDLEPKVLAGKPADEPGWRNLDVMPSIEFAPRGWCDLIGESAIGFTKQTDDVNSIEVTPRLGVRLHLFSRDKPTYFLRRERPPHRRVVFRDLVRVEFRSFFYTGEGDGTSSNVRFRNRLEFMAPLNVPRLTDAGARYVLADWEWFVPLGDPAERFANKQRIRAGLGYRHSTAWRYQLLYMWTRSRNTIEQGFTTTENIVDFQVKRVF